MKDLCQKWKGETNFPRRLCRLSGTGIVECLEVTDVGSDLKGCAENAGPENAGPENAGPNRRA